MTKDEKLAMRAKEIVTLLDDSVTGLSTAAVGVALGGIDYSAAYRRISEARWWLINTVEGQKTGVVLPRATQATKFLFIVTNSYTVISARETTDYRYMRTMCVRLAREKRVQYNALPSKGSSIAKKLKVEYLQAEADVARYDEMIDILEKRSGAVT